MDNIIWVLQKLNLLSVSYAISDIENQPLNLNNSPTSNLGGGFSFFIIILFTILLLVGFLFLYFYMSNKTLSQTQNMGEYLKILERKRLGRDSFLYILKLKDKGAVIAENSAGINVLFTIDDTELLKEIEINTMNKFENISFDNFLKKESYRIANLKNKTSLK